ncbi:hypothetical protein [Turicimonas muris]|nr:hypothetical protein [Turicimonas muris]
MNRLTNVRGSGFKPEGRQYLTELRVSGRDTGSKFVYDFLKLLFGKFFF